MTACSEDEAAVAAPESDAFVLIDISGNFFDADVTMPADGTLFILNHDDSAHTVTSQSAPGAFDNTGDFDVIVPSDFSQVVQLPDNAAPGQVYHFYCRFHLDAYADPNGSITVE